MLKQSWFDRRLPIINRLLLTAIILINAYIILLPFLPKVSYEVSKFTSDTKSINTPEERKAIDRSKNHVVILRGRVQGLLSAKSLPGGQAKTSQKQDNTGGYQKFDESKSRLVFRI